MAKSVRALQRELKAVKAAAMEAADAFRRLDEERDDKLDYVNSRCADLNGIRAQQRDRIAHLESELRKEQQFSTLISACLHGVLAMTMRHDQPVTDIGERA